VYWTISRDSIYQTVQGEIVKLILLMIWKEFLHLRNDKMSIKLMIFPVIAQALIMGYALTTEVKHTPVTVFDNSRSLSSRSLISSIRTNELFNFKTQSYSYNEVRERIDRGDVRIGMIIPKDFEADLKNGTGANIQLVIDGQDANSSNVSSGYLNAVISQWGSTYLKKQAAMMGKDIDVLIPVKVNPVILFNPTLKSTWYMVPALVVLLITMVTSLLTGLSIVREKEKGTLEQLMVTPVKPIHLIFGKTIPYLLIGFVELCIFIGFVLLWFGIPFKGSFFVLLLFAAVYMMSSLGIGILTSTIARTSQQVLFLIWFVLIFFILLSGFFIPVENMPIWVQNVTAINPVKYFMFAVRELCLKGTSLNDMLPQLYNLAIIGAVVFFASVLFFHRSAS
jgi:ABC-2 type transport system permease protein